MEITIAKDILLDGLDKIGRILPSKPPIASLGGIHLDGKKDGISLTATDLQLTLKVFLEGTVKDREEILFPGKKFISLVKEIPEKTIQLTTKENALFLGSKNFQYKFLLMNVEDYPKLPSEKELFNETDSASISALMFLDMISKTKYCINQDEPRMYFRGVLVEGKGKTLAMVATDTRRLSLVKKTVAGENEMKIILPVRLLEVLSSIIKEETLRVAFTKNQISFQSDRIILTSQLLEGEFPDYEKVIPTGDALHRAGIETKPFYESLSRLSLLSSEKFNSVKLNFRKDHLYLSFESPELGTGEEKLRIEYSGPDTNMIFNPEYIIDFLKTATKEKVEFSFLDGLKPALLKEEGETGYQYVVMPIKP